MIVQRDTSIRHPPLATLPVVQVFTTVSQIPIFPHHQTHHCPKIHNKVNLRLVLQHQLLWLTISQGNQVPPQALTNCCNTTQHFNHHFSQPPSSQVSPLLHPGQPFNPQIPPPYFPQYAPSNSPSMGSEASYLAVIHKQLER